MERPLISVIMPVYNGEKYLREAIESVLAQTYTRFELLLINDGSTDSSKDIILSYNDPRIRYIENERNLKLIATLNKGIDLANGDFIARMDADDVCLPKRFEKQVQFMKRHPEVAVCGTWAYRIDGEGRITGKIKNIDTPELLQCLSYFSCPFIHPSVMAKANVLKENHYSSDMVDTEDLELWHRLMLKGYKFANLPQFLMKYRWHGENISAHKEEYMIATKKRIFRPAMEAFWDRELSDEEMSLHLYSFLLYHYGSRQSQHPSELFKKEKNYLELLYQQNILKQQFKSSDWGGLLYSRWVVCCISKKNFQKILSIKLPWYNPKILFKAFKLLIYK